MVQAIKPSDIPAEKVEGLPDKVLEVWNAFIAKKYTAGRAYVNQGEIVTLLAPLTESETRREVFSTNWLDVEEIYRAQGWKVVYDKPGFNETYEANFTFTAAD